MRIARNRLLVVLSIAVVAVITWFVYTTSDAPFSKGDVRRAQDLIGLQFTAQEIDTMYNYLERNRKGYDSMRAIPINNEVFPAVLFDPLPAGFQIEPMQSAKNVWSVPATVFLPGDEDSLAFCSIPQLASLLRSGQVTSVALTEMYLERLVRFDTLEAVITLTTELAMSQAKKADEELAAGIDRGPLHGIPYGVKDLMAVPNYPTTWGAMPYKDQNIGYMASVVQQLEDAGAVLVAN